MASLGYSPSIPSYPSRRRLHRLLTILRTYYVLFMQRRKQRMQLAQLGDAQLKDIGISRSEARIEAAKPCWRR